ncbi:Arginine-tRNA-protein transferase [Methylophaga frappieri]|uniref:Arginine-tRNA-protein transferase n=1 Tax=Methylophaga frappieri (strain ATCC BAA-2434 / DSM 25690 / JAM7) TaxID=754477 RepID=I1YFV6_METFJ|nr:Arginine-tRNA-protein transferase [Methylophaga frappieri]
MRDNADVEVRTRPVEFDEQHYALYQRYLSARHPGGGMDNPTPQSFQQFLTSTWSDTGFIELWENTHLIAVAVTDFVNNGLSAFYTFFEPDLESRSLGTLAILKQIELARQQGKTYLYLGYWIAESQKMNYKTRFSALQFFDGRWRDFDKNTLNNQ